MPHSSTLCSHFSAPTLGVSANESIFLPLPPFSFSLMTGCPGDSVSWPCLHQVRCISFYFVFHQLWLHKTPLVSGDYCQKLQSPLFVGSFACFTPPPQTLFIHLPTDRYLLKTRGPCSTWDGPDSVTDSKALAGHHLSGS